jgi:myosin heavy subunit
VKRCPTQKHICETGCGNVAVDFRKSFTKSLEKRFSKSSPPAYSMPDFDSQAIKLHTFSGAVVYDIPEGAMKNKSRVNACV